MKSTPMVLDVIHNARQGIDLMAMPWERKTRYAAIDPEAHVVVVPISAEQEGGIVDETDRGLRNSALTIRWRCQPEKIDSGRNISPRAQKEGSESGHIMTTASARVLQRIATTNTAHPTESMLEADVLLVLVVRSLRPGRSAVVAIETQVPVVFYRDGLPRTHWFDLVLTYANGRKGYYAVKKEGDNDGAMVETDMKEIANQVFATSRCFTVYVSGDKISKLQVNLARETLNAKTTVNETLKNIIASRLNAAGGRATVHSLLTGLPIDITYSDGWTAIYQLIGLGIIHHDHPSAGTAPLAARSWVRIAKGQENGTSRAA